MAAGTVLTIIIICISYSQIIEAFPTGGGGYLVASKLLSPTVGVVSGCALIGDYILTIALSVASGADAMFSMLPVEWQVMEIEIFPRHGDVSHGAEPARGQGIRGALGAGVCGFVLSYTFAIVWAISAHFGELPDIAHGVVADVNTGAAEVGWLGLVAVVLRAYSLGRGHLHRHRGRQQRPEHPARTPSADRQTHNDLHGGVAVVRRRRTAAGVFALSRHTG